MLTVAPSNCSTNPSPLFLFIDFDLLSDRQIEEVGENTVGGHQPRASGVLLAPPDFAARLEQPPLRILKERLAAHFCVQAVGDDEVIPLLHNQLLAQRDRRSETRGFRRGILVGLSAFGLVAAAASSAFWYLHPTAEQVYEAPASIEERRLTEEQALRPTGGVAMTVIPAHVVPEIDTTASTSTPTPLSARTVLPPAGIDSLPPIDASASAHLPSGPSPSATEISELVEHGDAFFSAHDISSARLYYERAAEAGDAEAALRLGASFDRVMLDQTGARGVNGDPAQALLWYRRARELGMGGTEHRIKNFHAWPWNETDNLPR
jgi:hypothetical protein